MTEQRTSHYGNCDKAFGGYGRCTCPVPTPAHCESCGSTDYEDLETGDQGYTACCNEPVVEDCRTCSTQHSFR